MIVSILIINNKQNKHYMASCLPEQGREEQGWWQNSWLPVSHLQFPTETVRVDTLQLYCISLRIKTAGSAVQWQSCGVWTWCFCAMDACLAVVNMSPIDTWICNKTSLCIVHRTFFFLEIACTFTYSNIYRNLCHTLCKDSSIHNWLCLAWVELH